MVFLIPVAVILAFIVFCALMTTGEALNPTRPLMSYDQAREHARKLQQLIRCRTVAREEAEFEKFYRTLEELFPMVHQSCQVMTFGDGCRVYVLPGLDEEQNILFLASHGVAPAEGEWKHPPFSGIIADGKLWGRGAVASKTTLYGMFAALEELLGEGVWPNCNVWIVTSPDRTAEDGMDAVADFFREQKLRFSLVLGEGGAVTDPPIKGMYCPKCAMVGVHERQTHRLTLEAVQDAPSNATPTERMAEFISAIRKENRFIRRLTPRVEEMLREMTPYMRFSGKILFANLWCFRSQAVRKMPHIAPQYTPLMGTDCQFNHIETLDRGQRCVATIELHSVHKEDWEQDLKSVKNLAAAHGILVNGEAGTASLPPADTAQSAYDIVIQSIRSVFPDVPVIPAVLPFGTEALHMTEFCDCVLRFAPLRLTAQQEAGAQGQDESVDITAIGACISFYRRLLEQYTSVWEEESDEQSEE